MSVYRKCRHDHDGWPACRLVFDKREIYCFCCRTSHNLFGVCGNWHCRPLGSKRPVTSQHSVETAWPAWDDELEQGEFSSCDLTRSLIEYRDLSIDCAIASHNPLHRMLAILDARFGKRRLRAIDCETLHPIAFAALRIRVEAEDMDPRTADAVANTGCPVTAKQNPDR